MAQYVFGAGVLWGTPLTDASGNAITNPSPIQFGTMQECGVDFNFETKLLHGTNQFPVAVGRGKGKVSGKAKFAQINGALFNSLFFGQTMTSGITSDVYDTTGKAIPANPYQVTVTSGAASATNIQIPNSGTFAADLGVRDANGIPMTRVAAAPATGQYSLSGSTYTFAAADTGLTVFISYQYTATSTVAKKSTVQNVAMGYAPTFRADIYVPYEGKSLVFVLNKCISTKLGFSTKLDDFTVPEFDFEAFADNSGNVATWAVSE